MKLPSREVKQQKGRNWKGEWKKTAVSIEGLFIFLVQSFCTKGFSTCTDAENNVLSL